MTAYLLIHGGWHGGWCWDKITSRLEARGHTVLAPTLSGVSERFHENGPHIGLATHIADTVAFARDFAPERFVLVGHSYGGMVISGAAEELESRLAGMAFVDAFVPRDGESVCSIAGFPAERDVDLPAPPTERWNIRSADDRALIDLRTSPQSSNTACDPVRLTGARERVSPRTFVYGTAWDDSPFAPIAERLSHDPSWRLHALPTGHHPMLDAPDELAAILHEDFAA